MYKNICGGLMILVLMFGCKEEVIQTLPISTDTKKVEESFQRVFSDDDYNFQVEYNNRLDTSYLDVLYKGKKINRYGYKGRVKSEFLADLNMDRKNELYVEIIQGKNSELFGYHFDNGNASEIIKKSYGDKPNATPTSYKIVRGQLVEQYNMPIGKGEFEKRISKYNLVRRKNELVLLPQGWHPKAIENMSGQYASRDASGAGYYKVMLLKNKGEGVWNVEIKVKRNEDKSIICDFNGDGFFLDENLIVPLNQVDTELSGALKITFLELLAAVYTVDPSDSKEMISFCDKVGSIAGNFKKTSI
jgi:hypothetical protein